VVSVYKPSCDVVTLIFGCLCTVHPAVLLAFSFMENSRTGLIILPWKINPRRTFYFTSIKIFLIKVAVSQKVGEIRPLIPTIFKNLNFAWL
jgi:hypothetical protein